VQPSRRRILLAACAIGVVPFAFAQTRSDLAREKRWADQVLPSLVVGDAVTVQAKDGTRFLALWALPERARGAVMLLHGPGLHPDHGITGELRVALVDRGFATLSLQMPVLPAEVDDGAAYQALYPEAGERIAAGIAFLRGQGHGRVRAIHGLDRAQQELGPLVVERRLPEPGSLPGGSYEGEGYVVFRHPETAVVARALERVVELVRVELA